jgi:hypothetical protein
MLRIKTRALAATVCVLLLQLSVAVPAAHARPDGPCAVAREEGAARWLDAAVAWLERLLAGDPPQLTQTSEADGAAPMTGSCIDPQGTKPCSYL